MQDLYQTLDDFIAYMYDKRTGSDKTADSYYRDIARFITFMEDNEIASFEQIGKDTVFDYINLLRSGKISRGKISNATYARNLSALRSFYRYLCERHICEDNPFIQFGKVHVEKHLPDVLTFDQVERLLDVFDLEDPMEVRNRCILETRKGSFLTTADLTNSSIFMSPCTAMIMWMRISLIFSFPQEKEKYRPGPCNFFWKMLELELASASTCIRICSGIPLRRICWTTEPTFGPFRNCWVMRIFPRHSSIHI